MRCFETMYFSILANFTSFGYYPISCDYSFIIRDFVGCVQAKGNVSNLNTTLENVNGTEIVKIRTGDSAEPTNNPPNILERYFSLLCYTEQGNAVHAFEVLQNNVPIGVIKYAAKEPAETCLQIHNGNNDEFVVRAISLGNFVVSFDTINDCLTQI